MTSTRPTCSWCGSHCPVVPDRRNGRATGRWVCADRGTADHPLTACFVPWLLGEDPDVSRARIAAETTSAPPVAVEEVDDLTPRLAAVVKVLDRQGWTPYAWDLRALAWQLRSHPDVRAAVTAALAA